MFESSDGGKRVSPLVGPCPAVSDRRGDRRYATVFRAARLGRRHGDGLCLIRNISAGGAMAHVYAPVMVDEPVTIELRSGPPLPGRVRWARGNEVGIRFDARIDIARLLAGDAQPPECPEPRSPRLSLGVYALIRCGACSHPAILHDISQGGAKIDAADWVVAGAPVVLRIAGLPTIAGAIRWRDRRRAGIAFDQPVPLETLARWAAASTRSWGLPFT
jgi:hypothetical protein